MKKTQPERWSLINRVLTTANILSNDIEQKTKITITVKRTIEVSFYK